MKKVIKIREIILKNKYIKREKISMKPRAVFKISKTGISLFFMIE